MLHFPSKSFPALTFSKQKYLKLDITKAFDKISFFEIVKTSWETPILGNPQFILAQKLKCLKSSLKHWSKEHFGNILQNIREAEARVELCQQHMDSSPSENSQANLVAARSDLHSALKAQEAHWRQRSRVAWLEEGDQNTKFFHQAAKSRSSTNKILHISDNGRIEEDPAIIQAMAVEHFTKLFQPLDCFPSQSLFQVDSPKVSASDNSYLTAMPSAEEIKEVVFGLKKDSSPGPDGFNGVFFTSSWNIIGITVSKAVQHFFCVRRLHKASNSFFLALIPKTKSPSNFTEFRPISLLNFSYKIISKIIASRLARIIPKLISNHQAAFIKGRNIQQHTGLAFELFQKLSTKQSKGSFCLKLDITKAFDKLNWSFLFSVLQFFNFSETWINLIKECICTAKCSVLVNRTPQGYFSSFCGLRQGDPLSPYLFILAEEILSLHLNSLLHQGIFRRISSIPSTPCHLLYADDILIFMKGNTSSILVLQDLLETYQAAAGQFFNLQKSHLYIGKCSSRRKSNISSVLGISESQSHLKYLGTPICFGTPKRRHFSPLLDIVNAKLSAWKAKSLSFAGRLILIKHVLSSLPIHLAATLPIPISICRELDRLMRKFLWSGNAPHSKINYVNWATVTLPKEEGGLGIRLLEEVSTASFLKLGWLASTTSSLWSKWFKDRYFKFKPIWHHQTTIYGSCIWKKLRRLAPLLHNGSTWDFGNGQDINLWRDSWNGSVPLADRFPFLLLPQEQPLFSLFQQGSWSIPTDSQLAVQVQLTKQLIGLSPCVETRDRLRWSDSPDGHLSLQAAWRYIRHRATSPPWPKFIWNHISPPKLQCFGWRLMHNKTPTESFLKSLGIALASRCSGCLQHEETAHHLFFSCAQAKSIWLWIFSVAGIRPPSSFSAAAIWQALTQGNDHSGSRLMAVVFLQSIYSLWQVRNKTIFEDFHPPLHHIIQQLQVDISVSLKKIYKAFCSPQLQSICKSLQV